MPNGKVDEGEIALIIGEGGLKKATLARRKRIRAHFQAFTMENYQKDLAEERRWLNGGTSTKKATFDLWKTNL